MIKSVAAAAAATVAAAAPAATVATDERHDIYASSRFYALPPDRLLRY